MSLIRFRLPTPILGVLACLMVSVAAFLPNAALADHFPPALVQGQRDEVAAQRQRMADVASGLEGIDPVDWTPTQTYEYLQEALWTVYNGLNLYFYVNGELPDLASLAGTEYVPDWPANPYNSSEPIRILQLSDGFSAGDITFQICPPEFYSYPANPRPISCELSIFGPNLEFGELGNARPSKDNTWAATPPGAYLMLGQYAETASVTAEKFRQLEEQLAQAEQQAIPEVQE